MIELADVVPAVSCGVSRLGVCGGSVVSNRNKRLLLDASRVLVGGRVAGYRCTTSELSENANRLALHRRARRCDESLGKLCY